jgi:hypothetical protein
VPEAGEHVLGAASILASNVFYLHYAVKQFKSKRPFLGLLLCAAAGASMFYHGFQILHGTAACLTHKACYIDTSIALTSGIVHVAKCGLPRPHLSLMAVATFFIGPSCGPLYAVSHSAWCVQPCAPQPCTRRALSLACCWWSVAGWHTGA